MLRLLERARSHAADPELFAGLVQACRYAGLERPAIAAYEHARRLEPGIRTAVSHAYFMAGEYERVGETDRDDPPMLSALALDLLGRRDEALAALQRLLTRELPGIYRRFIEAMVTVLDGAHADPLAVADDLLSHWRLRDPCATYFLARTLAALRHPRAMETFRRAVEGGFHAYSFFIHDPWLDPLRTEPGFKEIVAMAEREYREAAEAFVAAGGERVLGPVRRV
jgi:tetratricopeptide (TPR) repeat protein